MPPQLLGMLGGGGGGLKVDSKSSASAKGDSETGSQFGFTPQISFSIKPVFNSVGGGNWVIWLVVAGALGYVLFARR